MRRFCEECGTGLEADALFCENCGTVVETTETVVRTRGHGLTEPSSGRGVQTRPYASPPRTPRRPQVGSASVAFLPEAGASTWLHRVGAVLVESAISIVITYVPLLIALGTRSWDALGIAAFFLLLAPLCFAILNCVLLLRRGRRNGQSLGKQIVGVRIVRENGLLLRFRHLLGRGLAQLICGFIFPVDLLWPLWDRNDQTLHDKLAHTRVLRLAEAPAFIAAARGLSLESAVPSRHTAEELADPDDGYGEYAGYSQPRQSPLVPIAALAAAAAFIGGGSALLITRHNEISDTTASSFSGFANSDLETPAADDDRNGPVAMLRAGDIHDEWPDDTDAYTVFLAARKSIESARAEVQNAREHGIDAHVLESRLYPRLLSGYYVVYTDTYGTEADAKAHLAQAKSVHADAYVRWVSPQGNAAPKSQRTTTTRRRQPGPPAPYSAEYTRAEQGSFTIDVPVGWTVTDDQVEHDGYVETRWESAKDPNTSVLVDVTADSTASAFEAASDVRDQTSSESGYSRARLEGNDGQWRDGMEVDLPGRDAAQGRLLHQRLLDRVCGAGQRERRSLQGLRRHLLSHRRFIGGEC